MAYNLHIDLQRDARVSIFKCIFHISILVLLLLPCYIVYIFILINTINKIDSVGMNNLYWSYSLYIYKGTVVLSYKSGVWWLMVYKHIFSNYIRRLLSYLYCNTVNSISMQLPSLPLILEVYVDNSQLAHELLDFFFA